MAKSVTKSNVKVRTSAELLSYIINETPILRENIDLPVQGQSINPIGQIIMKNVAYKNAFLNTINIIGINVITRNTWRNPWETFTNKGNLSYGQQVREIICDLADVYDYNEMLPIENDFIKTVVPDVLSYIHELNFQKFWKTTTSDEQMAMAFQREDLFSLVDQVVSMLYTSYQYDIYQVAKYVLARRILDGTVPAYQIADFSTKTDREIVAEIKAQSNKMTFMSPNYNPAGVRKATSFDDQLAIVSSDFDAKFSTMVLSTSYFRSDADMKARLELTESFGTIDTARLNLLFAKRDSSGAITEGYVAGYTPLTADELSALEEIPVVLLDRDFFQFYKWSFGETDNLEGLRKTEFFNPETYKTNHILGGWLVCSSSPFANCLVITQSAQGVTRVTVSPSTATISAGGSVDLSATVVTTGFANKAVTWSVDSTAKTAGITIDQRGHLTIPAGVTTVETVTATATSVYDSTVTGTATITNASYSG